jgi:putative acetyltransferase
MHAQEGVGPRPGMQPDTAQVDAERPLQNPPQTRVQPYSGITETKESWYPHGGIVRNGLPTENPAADIGLPTQPGAVHREPVPIRREATRDTAAIHAITAAAFTRHGQPPGQDPPEARLVGELRASPAWLPRLSLVAVTDADEVIDHVLCTRGHADAVPVLGLGPLTVRPDRQRRGAGSALMHAILGAAEALGEPLVALLGDPAYYRRFGSGSPPTTRSRRPDRTGTRTSRSAS